MIRFTSFCGIFFFFSSATILLDGPTGWQVGFQLAATPFMEGITNFHNELMFILVWVGVFVGYLLDYSITFFRDDSEHTSDSTFTHSTGLEIGWTLFPAFVLVVIAFPSFALLYALDEVIDPTLTLKVIGHQWYWTYEYSDTGMEQDSVGFDSYMVPEEELVDGGLRLLEVDNRVVLPLDTHIRVIVTSADVLHSWAVPAFGTKVDACPGRLNQVGIFINREGTYYGQCSEICGVNHGFMPIVIEGRSHDNFTTWLVEQLS
jgi:cytochrome c oxidase subunit 2